MFKSFFRHKKQEEPRGFQPKKRYSGPAMRLEEMRTPSGLILGDDTDTTDEPIPADDLDFPLNSPADDTGNNADFDPNDNDTDSSDASDIPDNETEEIEDIDPDDSDSDDTAAETDSDSDDTDSDETDSDDIDSDDATAETDSDETAAHTETDDIADEDLEKLDYIDSDETDSDETDSDETAAHTETDTDDTTAEASDTGESIPSDDIDGEETGETTSELDDTDTAEIASDDSELVAEVASTDNQTASDDSELVAETNPNDTASEANPDSEITDNDTTEESSDNFVVDAELNPNQINFDVGTFTVGETGQVSADFLFDGGKYEGEVAIFNLEGMDEFEFGTPEFIQEAARRSLSSSDMGHVVISDITAAARFDPQYGVNQNLGTYQGVQTFAMRPGDTFAIMLVPKGSVQQVFDNPAATGALRPLFSLATANPNDAHHIGQIADVTGDGSTFAMEDLRVDGNTDKDYNDIIFQVRGAKGTAPLIDQLVAAGKDWRGTNVGKALIEYATPYITPDEPNFDGALSDLVSNLESLFGEVETDGDGLDIASDSTDATDEVFSSDEPKTEELVGDAATDELFASDETETEELVEDATTDEFFSSDETETEELVEDAATDEFFSSDEPETEELVGDAATDEFFSSDEPETEELVGDAATDELLSSDEPETASPVATDATDAEITDETVSETDETVATDATDAAITDETVSETEETVATDATDAVITDETVSETDETVATDATDAAITDATVSETESPVATDATDAAITDETVSETEETIATDATDAAITDETVSETDETIATDATDAAITDETVSETEETIATDATDAVITDETVSETEETVATDATDAAITDETVSETDETIATDATDAAITDETVSETEGTVATDATDAVITDETVSATDETVATDATDAAITDATVSETESPVATETTATATETVVAPKTENSATEVVAPSAEKTDAVTEVSSATPEPVTEANEPTTSDSSDSTDNVETVSDAGNEGNTVSTNSATPGSAAPATPSSTALAQNSNSVNNQNLISRLENLTNNLKQQNSNAAVGSGNNAVSTSLIQQVENLTQKLKTQNPSTPVSANTTALISRLEEMVVKTAPLPAPSQFNFAPANQPLVGVIDTGFAGNNPDINYERIILGQDRVDGDNNPLLAADEGNEHGTHVLGIIGATQNNDIGIDGINDDAPIWVGRAVGSGKWAESLVEFVDAAKVSGQPNAVVNLSLDLTQTNPDGSVTTRYEFTPQERAAIEYARQHNVMLVVAAGNDGGVMSALGQSSQEFDNIITVGAAKRVNDEVALSKAYDRAEYSSYGNGLDIMAPVGDSELSTVGDGVGTMAGTSVATAKVTGAASQIWAANPQLSYRQVIEILKKTATDLAETGFDTATGAGLLNMVAAVQLAKATKPEEYEPAPFLIPTTWSGQGKVTVRERAVNSNSIYLSTDLGEIVQFDLGTGQKRHIYQGQAFTDLAVAPNGKLYGSTFNHLFEINTSTGEETYIGGFGGPNINSLTFSPDGRLYGAEEKSGDVFEISPQTARLTYIGNLGGPSSGDMVFSGASQFFATVGSPLMERDRLVAFDLNTRRARTITELSDDQFYGLAMHNGQLIGYTARNQEIALDPLTGQIKSISVVPVSGAIWGAAQNYNNVSYNPSLSSDWQQAMEREYQDMKGLLGNPTGPYATASRSPQGTEGIWRAYETGTIHWTPQYGAVAVWLDLQREYNEHGGSGGWLGFPTQREHDWNGGKRTLFEGGYIYWDGQRAQAYRHGELPTPNWQQAMEREYQDMKGLLGNPTGSYAIAGRSPKGTEGIWRAYETGTIHWSSQYGAVALWHDLQREYNEHGGSGGWLGFPTQRERDWNGGKRTDFEGGFIYWDGQRATAYRNGEFVITKEYIDKFARVAARSPEIGGAKGPIEHRGNGFLFQPFESGHIEWNGQKFVVTIYGNGNPSVSPPINTPTQGPKIINQSGESGTGRLTAGTNFRSYPWVNDSTSPQLISAGTTFTLLEKVTTDDSTYPNWYKVRLSDGREGYFWANNVEKVGSNSGVPVGDVIKSLKTAIIGQESGYNYQAINPDSGALGFAQIMPGNLPSWSREALGYEITREQFLNSPDLQIRIIEHKLNQYYQNAITASGGNVDIAVRRVASAWYSGNPNLYTSTTPQYYNGNPYPSIADYTLSVLNKFHQAYGTGGSSSYSSNTGGINTGIDNTNPVEDDYYYDEDDIFKDYFEDDRGENVKSWSREQKLNAVIDHIKEYTVEYVKGLGEDALNDIIDSFNEIIDDIKKFPNIDWKALGVRIFDFVAAKLLGRTPVGRAVLAVGRGNSPSDMLAEVLNFIQNPDLGNLRQEIQQLWQDGKTVLGDLWNSINKLIEDFQNLPNSLDNAETEADLDEKGEKFVEASASPLLGLLANLIIGKVGSKFAGSGWSQKLKQQNKDKRTKKVKKSPERIHFDRVVRPSFWKHEAENNAANYSPENLARMRKGKPALDSNGNSLELHHKTPLEKGGTNDFTNLEIMTREDHRYGDNYSKNHPK